MLPGARSQISHIPGKQRQKIRPGPKGIGALEKRKKVQGGGAPSAGLPWGGWSPGPKRGVCSHPTAGRAGDAGGDTVLGCGGPTGTSEGGLKATYRQAHPIKAHLFGRGERTQVVPAFPLIIGCRQTICSPRKAPAPTAPAGKGMEAACPPLCTVWAG